MKRLKQLCGGALALAFVIGLSVPSAHAANVVETASEVDDLSTLLSLVGEAGLAETLGSAEDITVFAPTNTAFETLPSAMLRAIENDPSILVSILTYHVAPGRLAAADVANTRYIDTLAGQEIGVTTYEEMVLLDTSRVLATDIQTDNATVHLIDRVLVPWRVVLVDVIDALGLGH